MEFNDLLTRSEAAAELPLQITDELIMGTIRESTALALGRSVPVTTRDSRIPVLNNLPNAYWTSPLAGQPTADAGMIQTSEATFANTVLIAEELATIVPVPNNVIDDSGFDLWAAVRPLMVQSCAKAIDNAVIFGINAPVTFSDSIVQHASSVGNVVAGDVFSVTGDTPADNAGLVLQAAQLVSQQGRNVTACAVSPGWQYRAGVARTAALVANPLASSTPFPLLLAGMPLKTDPVRWPNQLTRTDAGCGTNNLSTVVTDAAAQAGDVGLPIVGTGIPAGTVIVAVTPGTGYTISQAATATSSGGGVSLTVGQSPVDAIIGAWDYLLIGLRKEIKMEVFTSGVISDNTGAITLNLITQNITAVRLTMRLGALVANPPSDYNGPKSPFALVVNSGSAGPVGAKAPVTSDVPVVKAPVKNGK
jgi:capsid protein